MQLDRTWDPTYASDASNHQPQASPYYSQSAYQPVQFAAGAQNATEAGGGQSPSYWVAGNKRVRANDHGLHEAPTAAYAGVPQYASHHKTAQLGLSSGSIDYGHNDAPQAYGATFNNGNYLGGFQHAHSSGQQTVPQPLYGDSAHSKSMARSFNHIPLSGEPDPSYQVQSPTIPQVPSPAHVAHGAEEIASVRPFTEQNNLYQPMYGILGGPLNRLPSDYRSDLTWPENPYPTYSAWNQIGTQPDTAGLYGNDVSLHLKLQSLAVLESLASQIIVNLAKPSLSDIERLQIADETEESQAYRTRKNLFDQTRRVYCRDCPFIDTASVQLFTAAQQEIVRKANRATFIASILEAHDISFYDLNERFFEVFVSPGQRLLKWQGAIYLELKTQVYISALMNSDGPTSTLLDELFPVDLEDRIIARHPDALNLTPSERDFLERAKARKLYLSAEPEAIAVNTLPRKYEWQDFLKEFLACVSKNVDVLLNPPTRSQPGFPVPQQAETDNAKSNGRVKQAATTSPDAEPSSFYSSFGALVPNNVTTNERSKSRDDPPTPAPPSTSSAAAASKPSKPATGGGTTTRQPWRQEEEDALLLGLEAVKGPHWSQILSLYGRGGSISEVLKDRNQIQLKDKARNLKLWHLKMGNEVPACLQGVTGELRKRGGARVRAALGLNEDGDGSTNGGDRGGGDSSSPGGSVKRKSGGGGAGSQRAKKSKQAIDPALDR